MNAERKENRNVKKAAKKEEKKKTESTEEMMVNLQKDDSLRSKCGSANTENTEKKKSFPEEIKSRNQKIGFLFSLRVCVGES